MTDFDTMQQMTLADVDDEFEGITDTFVDDDGDYEYDDDDYDYYDDFLDEVGYDPYQGSSGWDC